MITETERLSLIQWLIETKDENAISKIKEIKNESASLTEAQQMVLAKRLERYRNGETKFSSWDDVKKRIRSDAK
ncbi:MAG: addiction module protein [Taibaiella sp.]|jgi:putative addiction module component (TIGR02574 family)